MPFFPCPPEALAYLSRKDHKMGALIQRVGPIQREVTPDLFEALVRSMIGQQISSKAADTVRGRLQTLLGSISPERVMATPADAIQQCGLSHRKTAYLKGAGEAAASGILNLAALPAMTDEEVIQTLSALNGIGVWTAEMLLIFSLCRPDVVSYGDLGIRRGMMLLYGRKTLSREQFDRYRKRYSPYGSVASLYLWHLATNG